MKVFLYCLSLYTKADSKGCSVLQNEPEQIIVYSFDGLVFLQFLVSLLLGNSFNILFIQ